MPTISLVNTRISFILISILILSICCFSQKELVTDSLLNEMCISLKKSKEPNDSMKLVEIVAKHLHPLMSDLDEKESNDVWDLFFLRFQRQCDEFHKLLVRTSPRQGDWEDADSKPVTELTKQICSEFNKRKEYYYVQAVGDTVRVTIENGLWIEDYNDGTYSKLDFKWAGDCEFELTFISSNNFYKKNLSRKGDKYQYELLQKKTNHYKTSAFAVGGHGYSTFNLYY